MAADPDDDIFSDVPEGAPTPEVAPVTKVAETPAEPTVAPPIPSPQADVPTPEEMSIAAMKEKQAEIILGKLFDDGEIIKLSVGYWTAKKKLQAKDLGLKKEDLPDEVIALGQKRLVKKSSFETIKSIETKARSLLDMYSHESWIPGLRFISAKASEIAAEELVKLQKDFMAAAAEFTKQYPNLKSDMLKEYPQYAAALEPHYPSEEKIKKSFYFSFDQFKITVIRKEAQVLKEAKVAMKQGLMNKLDDFLKTSVVDARQKFIDELTAIKAKLDGGEKIHTKTINKIHEMISIAKTKDFVNDAEFFTMLDKFKAEFQKDTVNQPVFKKQVGETLDGILKKAGDEGNVEEAVTAYKRSILV